MRIKKKVKKQVIVIVLTYIITATLWIFFSDKILFSLIDDPRIRQQYSIYKGFFFVLVTAILLYTLINRLANNLSQNIKEKNFLLKELNHRINNTLQFIINLLNLERKRLNDPKVISLTDHVIERIRIIAIIYEKLYLLRGTSNIRLQEYSKDLVKEIINSYRTCDQNINWNIDIDDFILDLDQAIPVGLIICEAVTNSIKFAFKDRLEGKISVSLHICDDSVELIIADNGRGIPPEIDPEKTSSPGLKLIYGFVEKELDGKIELKRKEGTIYKIKFRRKDVG